MAKGDVVYKSYRGYGSGNNENTYDDEGRGDSKDLYERFALAYAKQETHLFNPDHISDNFIIRLIHKTVWRYGVHDFSESVRASWWVGKGDGRIKRDIVKYSGQAAWDKFVARVNLLRQEELDADWFESLADTIANRRREQQYAVEREQRREAAILRREQETVEYRQMAELTKGMIQSDFNTALAMKEAHNQRQGDWLDDPVSVYTTGYGFGEEIRSPSGVVLQITVSLDLSNSMRENYVAEDALKVFINLNMALEQLAKENEGSVYVATFTFSKDKTTRVRDYSSRSGYSDKIELGREAELVKPYFFDTSEPDDSHLGLMERFRKADTWGLFDGQDTWMYPLFETIEAWENENSEPGAVRLDLVISDAVLKHPSDLRQSDVIQERRDGCLQTVVLNLMDEKEWHGGSLPRRCVQYPVNVGNLAGMARIIISEFLQVYV